MISRILVQITIKSSSLPPQFIFVGSWIFSCFFFTMYYNSFSLTHFFHNLSWHSIVKSQVKLWNSPEFGFDVRNRKHVWRSNFDFWLTRFGKVQPGSISLAKDSQLESPLISSVLRKRNIAKFDQSASSSVKMFLPRRWVNRASVYLWANLIGQDRVYKKVKQILVLIF